MNIYSQADLHKVHVSGTLSRSKVVKLENTLQRLWNSSVFEAQKVAENVSVTVVGVEDTVDMATRLVLCMTIFLCGLFKF